MRIALDISQLAFPHSGVSSYVRHLVRGLVVADHENQYCMFGSSLRRQHLLSSFIEKDLGARNNFSSKLFPFPPRLLEVLWNRLHILDIECLVGSIDLLHTSDWIEPPAKCKKVTTVHDLLVFKYPQYMHPVIVQNQKKKLAWVKKECQLVIVDSFSTKQDAIELWGIEEKRLRVIYLGVDEHFVPQNQEKIRAVTQKYGIDGDFLLAIGTIEPRKNIQKLIAVFNKLSLYRKLSLVVVGQLVWGKNLQLSPGVKLINFVEEQDLPSLYGGAACLTYPSLYEGFGLPVLEAMASGCPVITSNRGSLKEVAGSAAIIVNPEDDNSIAEAIKVIINEGESKRQDRVATGISWSKKFSWETTVEKTLQVYKEIMDSIE